MRNEPASDGLGMMPRVKEPESAMMPGMAAPAPQPPARSLFRGRPILGKGRRDTLPAAIVKAVEAGELTGYEWLALLASMPDTSMNNPLVPAPSPVRWAYDFDPANGSTRAIFPGEAGMTGGLVGVTSGAAAPAGTVGEFITANASGVAVLTGTNTQLLVQSLTAGDWDVWGWVTFASLTVGSASVLAGAITLSTATMGTQSTFLNLAAGTILAATQVAINPQRFNFAATTNVFLNGRADFASGTASLTAVLNARRRR